MFKGLAAQVGRFLDSSYMTFTHVNQVVSFSQKSASSVLLQMVVSYPRIEGMTVILSKVGVLSSNIPQVFRLKGC